MEEIKFIEDLVYQGDRKGLNDLQSNILTEVWQGRKYLEIASRYGYTEGHVKDVASQLWKLLSLTLGVVN
jgi:hypothetical protein